MTGADADPAEAEGAENLMVVFTNPVDGREDEFNEWYDGVHVPEIMAATGISAVSRYEAAPRPEADRPVPPHKYLALYDLGDDPMSALTKLAEARPTLTQCDALDEQRLSFVYRKRSPRSS
jgi:hypothetical protein